MGRVVLWLAFLAEWLLVSKNVKQTQTFLVCILPKLYFLVVVNLTFVSAYFCILISHLLKTKYARKRRRQIECMQTVSAELKGEKKKKKLLFPEAYILHEIQLDKWPFQNSATKISEHSLYTRGSALVLKPQAALQFPLNKCSLFLWPLCSALSSFIALAFTVLCAHLYERKYSKKQNYWEY